MLIRQRRRDLGGFEVGRVLPFARRRMVGPFVFLDHMGPVRFEPGIPRSVDVRPHPHIGLSTVTYLFEGEITHRDSVGSLQPIRPGEVNWMTAGRGITHSERFERARREGGPMNGVQAWVALPREDEEAEPAFSHHGSEQLPTMLVGGATGRLVAGEAYGLKSPVKTHSPMFQAHWDLDAAAVLDVPPEYSERALYVVAGSVDVDGMEVGPGHLAVIRRGDVARITARTPSTLMLIGGEPVGERFIEWNFVSSSKERIEQAKADWRAGRMKLPQGDADEFVPFPGDRAPPDPMS